MDYTFDGAKSSRQETIINRANDCKSLLTKRLIFIAVTSAIGIGAGILLHLLFGFIFISIYIALAVPSIFLSPKLKAIISQIDFSGITADSILGAILGIIICFIIIFLIVAILFLPFCVIVDTIQNFANLSTIKAIKKNANDPSDYWQNKLQKIENRFYR